MTMSLGQLLVAIEKIRELHQIDNNDQCIHCEYAYPCPTIRMIDLAANRSTVNIMGSVYRKPKGN